MFPLSFRFTFAHDFDEWKIENQHDVEIMIMNIWFV